MTTLEAICAELKRQESTQKLKGLNLHAQFYDQCFITGIVDLVALAKVVDDNMSKAIKEELKKALDAL